MRVSKVRMCSGSEAGSYLRLKDFVYHSTPGLRVIKKKKKVRDGAQGVLGEEDKGGQPEPHQPPRPCGDLYLPKEGITVRTSPRAMLRTIASEGALKTRPLRPRCDLYLSKQGTAVRNVPRAMLTSIVSERASSAL